jgi:pimeloyl-ACP methyl ester carboxylesterase
MKLETVDIGDGISLATAQAGSGGDPLVLLHGFTGAKEDFADWLDPLADRGFHVVAPDQRGHGASSQPAEEAAYSLARFSTDAFALADALGFDRFTLLGHSMGGMVAQTMVVDDPDRIRALVLMDTCAGPVQGVAPDVVALAVGVARTQGLDVLIELQRQLQDPLATTADARVRAERPGYAEFGERKLRSSSAAMYAAMAAEITGPVDRLPSLASVAVPTLVLVGDEDDNFLAPSRDLAATIPGAELAVIPDAGHSPQFEAPDAWWAALHPFLERHRPAPG